MDFLSLQRALDKKKEIAKKEFTPEDIDALEYFSSMERPHYRLFDQAFGDNSNAVLDAAFEMFDIVDMESESVPLSFAEMVEFL